MPRCGGGPSVHALLVVMACVAVGCTSGDRPRPRDRPAGDTAGASASGPRAEFEAIRDRLREGDAPYHGRAPLRAVRALLARGAAAGPERFNALMTRAIEEMRQGDTAAAVAAAEEAHALLEAALPSMAPGPDVDALLVNFHLTRALANLRHAEVRNCIGHHSPDSCLFPIRGRGVHVERDAAERARESLLAVLERRPDDLGARWLVNLVAMALGEHPESLPEALRIDPEATQSSREMGRWWDVAPSLGIDAFDLAGGVVADDLDGDGLVDLVTSSSDPGEPLKLFRARPDGSFENATEGSGLEHQLGGLNLIGGDHDGDGDIDLLVLRGAWLFGHGRIRNSLLRNEGGLRFTDVTRAAGLAEPAYPGQAAAWGDLDNDGDLDLYVGSEGDLPPAAPYPDQLFRNEGDGTFTEVSEAAGTRNDRYAKGVTVGDYDNDGDLDIYVSNIGPNRLYRNDGGLRFTDVGPELGVTEPAGRSFAPWFFDFDNDGWLDLWVSAYDTVIDDVAADHLGLPHGAHAPKLYRNRRDGSFEDVAPRAGLRRPFAPMGANFGDLDGDGWLDVYLGTGDPDFRSLMPNVLLRNDAGRRFEEVTVTAGMGHLQKGHGIAFVDLDQDGDQDVYHQVGGFYPGDRFGNALFLNPGPPTRFLVVELVGRESPRSGHGARLRVTVDGPEGPRDLHRAVGSVSSFGGSPLLRQHVGLGAARAILELEVWWPTGGRDVHRDVPLDGRVRVTEGAAELEVLAYPRLSFPAGGSDGR